MKKQWLSLSFLLTQQACQSVSARLLIGFFLLWLGFFSNALALEKTVQPNKAIESETAQVKRVIDGDTIDLEDGRRVRYLGVNATEWQEPFSIKAKRRNRELVEGKTVRLEFDEQKMDGFQRLLAFVYVGDMMVNAKLVEEGLAYAFIIPPNGRYSDQILALQKKAKSQKVGIWSMFDNSVDLKITQLSTIEKVKSKEFHAYVRIANLSVNPVNIARYSIKNDANDRFIFPSFTVEPGYTFILAGGEGVNGYDKNGQLRIFVNTLDSMWNAKKGVAILTNPSGKVIGMYRYKGRRIFYGLSLAKVQEEMEATE
jgi:endonuclease YncB( thermonuclease family)